MRKILCAFFCAAVASLSAQDLRMGLGNMQNMDQNQRRAAVERMSPGERAQFLRQYREDMILQELNLPQDKEEQFRKVYGEYQESQRRIREQFRPNFQTGNMSDAEAQKQLDQSFEVTQQLLDNRKKYTDEFAKFLTPQQILVVFQSEGKMREKMMEQKQQGNFRNGPGNKTKHP